MLNAVGQAQSILLLGGTSEIGLAIVTEFLSKGPAKVVLAARKNSPRLDSSVALVKAAGASEVEVIDFDATDFANHPKVIDKAFAGGDIDIAIVAFGTLGDQEALWHDQKLAVESAQTNFTGPVSVGVLLAAGQRVRRSNFVYGAAKAGMDGFYVNLGEALRDVGVNVLVVRPGQVRTKMSTVADEPEAPLTVNKEDVAKAVVDAVVSHKEAIFVHPLFQPVSLAFKVIPQKIFRKLPF